MGNPLVLIAEDNEKQCALIAQTVKETGFCEPVIAHNGKQALEAVRKNKGLFTPKIKCILLDWQMPEMSGEQFLKWLRQEERGTGLFEAKEIPVIIISAYNDTPRRNFACDVYDGRVCAYLVKPFQEQDLVNLLRKIIKNKQGKRLRTEFFYQRLEEIADKRQALLDQFSNRSN